MGTGPPNYQPSLDLNPASDPLPHAEAPSHRDEPPPAAGQDRGPPALVYILALGGLEVLIIYLLLVVESPVSAFARRAAETWPGRAALAVIGWLVITVFMVVLLTFLEKRRGRT